MEQDTSDNYQYKNLATAQLVVLFEEFLEKKRIDREVSDLFLKSVAGGVS
jgi:hypothetical protein